jgi:hypothetical protein
MEEKENIIGEQPNMEVVHPVATDLEEGTLKPEGSPLGKFKDANKLYDAYNELQSEFTRKCQRLSETEKKLQEINTSNNASREENNVSKEFAWSEKTREFLQSHKNASSLVSEITNEIINDETLRKCEDGLDKAYARVIERKYIPEEELVKDENFLNKYVYLNEEIKNKIIKEYVLALKSGQNPIAVNNSGFSRGVVSNNNQFNSLADAKKYVENMFRF